MNHQSIETDMETRQRRTEEAMTDLENREARSRLAIRPLRRVFQWPELPAKPTVTPAAVP